LRPTHLILTFHPFYKNCSVFHPDFAGFPCFFHGDTTGFNAGRAFSISAPPLESPRAYRRRFHPTSRRRIIIVDDASLRALLPSLPVFSPDFSCDRFSTRCLSEFTTWTPVPWKSISLQVLDTRILLMSCPSPVFQTWRGCF